VKKIRGRIVTPRGIIDGTVALEQGRIAEVSAGPDANGSARDFGDAWIVPGFIDIHMHGLGKHVTYDVVAMVEVARMQSRFGTTGFLPGVASMTEEQYLDFGRNVVEAREQAGPETAEILGAHFEGPFINPAGKGGMDEAYLRPIDLDECRRYLDVTGDALKLMTLSPELPGAEALIHLLRDHGVVASIGHSRANPEQLDRAVDAGLTQVCHVFNTFERSPKPDPDWPWAPGLLDAVLDHPGLDFEVVCDMVHVRPEHVLLVAQKAGPDRFLAITDSLPGAGLPPGEYEMVDGRMFSTADGAARLVSDGTLVGSVLTMNRALANLIQTCRIDPVTAVKYTSTNAARALGLAEELGSIEPGKRANLAVLDEGFDCLATLRDGRLIHEC